MLSFFTQVHYGQASNPTTELMKDAPKLYIDYRRIDMDYVRRKVPFVNYVVDRKMANVFLLVTTNRTASSGKEYTFTFIGHDKYAGINDTLTFYTENNDTEDIIRSKFVKLLKIGLFQYMVHTPLINQFELKFKSNAEVNKIKDNWNYWVYRIRLKGGFSGEEYVNSFRIKGELDADRITEEWKLRFNTQYDYDEDSYSFSDSKNYVSSSQSWRFKGLTVKSLSQHWSLGGRFGAYSSTYKNIDLSYGIGPAIEYNYFPYSESTYHDLRLNYSIGYIYQHYSEMTIYNKMKEGLLRQSLELTAEVKQPWGDIEFSTEYSNYLHDLSKNRFRVYADVSLNLVKGFAFSISGGYSMIHDQISLPAEDMDFEDILLRRGELATQYDYWFSYGIRYTFGSIYNNIVNPRF